MFNVKKLTGTKLAAAQRLGLAWKTAAKREGWYASKRSVADGETDESPSPTTNKLHYTHSEFACFAKSQGSLIQWQIQHVCDGPVTGPVTLQLISGLADTVEQAQDFIEAVLPSLVYAMEQSRQNVGIFTT